MTRRSVTVAMGSVLIALLIAGQGQGRADDGGARPLLSGLTSAVNGASLRACTHPTFGFPTCYSLQADGMWAREEVTLDEKGMSWEVVGTVTCAEVVAAIGEGTTNAP